LLDRDQRIKVPANPGRADPETLRDLRRRDGAPLKKLPGHVRPRLLLVRTVWRIESGAGQVFHNTSVTQLRSGVHPNRD